MAKRHDDALLIQHGACNPSGIAHSIIDACREIRNEPEYIGTSAICLDPAIRLMVHQLAYICGIINGAEEFAVKPSYSEATDACCQQAPTETVSRLTYGEPYGKNYD